MNWYVAELIVECRVGRARPALWDQQLVVLRARNARAAYATAMTLGRKQNHTYPNVTGDTVRWRFKGLGDLQEILARTLRSGTEVHSRLSRKKQPRTCPKARLTVFWVERNQHRTAGQLLSDGLRPFAPR
jgi:Domain of unknown function (DUF4288)